MVDEHTLFGYNMRDEAVLRLSVSLVGGGEHNQTCYFDDMMDDTGFTIWVKTFGLQNRTS